MAQQKSLHFGRAPLPSGREDAVFTGRGCFSLSLSLSLSAGASWSFPGGLYGPLMPREQKGCLFVGRVALKLRRSPFSGGKRHGACIPVCACACRPSPGQAQKNSFSFISKPPILMYLSVGWSGFSRRLFPHYNAFLHRTLPLCHLFSSNVFSAKWRTCSY